MSAQSCALDRDPDVRFARSVILLAVISLGLGMPVLAFAPSSSRAASNDMPGETNANAPARSATSDVHLPPPISGRPTTREGLMPADVLARLNWFDQELEAIRWYMGKPQAGEAPFSASRTSLHENIFQALTLYDKARQFALEQTGELAPELGRPDVGDVRPYDVWVIVNAALDRLLSVKRALGLAADFSEAPAPDDTIPTDVFRAILKSGRQLNLLLDRGYEPRDVYRQVTLAIHYAARLLSQFPTAVRLPPTPPFEPGKRPRDVMFQLLACYDSLRVIAQRSRVTILTLQEAGSHVPVTPNDVYDIASLIVSELAYIHARLPHAEPPLDTYDPGRKFPAHVYQRASLLKAQLLELERQVSEHPDWLEARRTESPR